MSAVQATGFPDAWEAQPLWTRFRRTTRTGHQEEQLLSVYRDYGVVKRGFTDDNWNFLPDDLSKYQLVEPGDIVVNKMKAWQGSLGVSSMRGVVSPAYFVFAPTGPGYHPRFLNYLLRSRPFVESYQQMSDGVRVNQWDLDPWGFSRLTVPTPPMSTQVAIADYLDRETAQIDAFIEKQEGLVDLLRERRQAVIERSTTLGITSEALVETGNVWVPVLPSTWSLTRIKLVTAKSAGGTPDTDDPDMWTDEEDSGTPWVAIGDMSKRRRVTETVKRVSEQGRSSRRLPVGAPGTVLFAMYASVGEVAQLTTPACWNQALLGLSGRPGLVANDFLYYALLSMKSRFSSMFRSNTQNNLNAAQVGNLDLALPPLGSQLEIVNYLDRETEKVDALIVKAQRFIDLARERRAALITAAVTGQIDVKQEAVA